MGFRGWKNLLGAEPTVFPSNGKTGTAAGRIFPDDFKRRPPKIGTWNPKPTNSKFAANLEFQLSKILDETTYWSLLSGLIDAALLAGPAVSHAGTRPPRKSTKHPPIKNLELWAFKTHLPEFPFPLYFKFALKPHPKTGNLHYFHIDCHPDR